jgi:hypothetical protein
MVIINPADRLYVQSSRYSSEVLQPGERRVVKIVDYDAEMIGSKVNTGHLNKWFLQG